MEKQSIMRLVTVTNLFCMGIYGMEGIYEKNGKLICLCGDYSILCVNGGFGLWIYLFKF